MKTLDYNPSYLEIVIAEAIGEMHLYIDERLKGYSRIIDIERQLKLDNPRIIFLLEDQDGDRHRVVVQVIQTLDPD
jgi:hypothetical protein